MQITDDAIEAFRTWYRGHVGKMITRANAARALEAALAAQPQAGEPIAWTWRDKTGCDYIDMDGEHAKALAGQIGVIPTPLYASPPEPQAGWQPTHRHLKRGSEYEHLGAGRIQSDIPLTDMAAVEVYREQDGKLWVRRQDEFHDGRFEVMPPNPEVGR